MNKIPKDNQIRKMLDPVSPALLFPAFGSIRERLQQSSGLLASFRCLGGHTLIALDGTEYFCSDTLCCENCSTRRRRNGKTEYFHTMLTAALVGPGHDKVIPLEPEFIAPQDGAKKQDCETMAAKRWLAAHGPHYASLKPVYLGDDLFARQSLCEAVQAAGAHFIFTCKPSSHSLIQEYITGVELPTHEVRIRRGKKRSVHRYRWLCDVPLRDGEDALCVNWFEIEIINAAGEITYRNSFVTDLPVDASNVAELADCGRARWKIENETFNVLKTKGYNLGHNFGHGKQYLSAVLATLNQIVSFCPPDLTLFRMGRDRGYLSRGRCPGDFEPMLKPVVAVEGDEVEVTDDGVVVNGRLIANTAPHARDGAGRPMPFPPIGLRVVGPGEVWFASGYAASSFDSRYFGAVLAAQIEGLARPLWVWETAP